jgi:hypothetical protein
MMTTTWTRVLLAIAVLVLLDLTYMEFNNQRRQCLQLWLNSSRQVHTSKSDDSLVNTNGTDAM